MKTYPEWERVVLEHTYEAVDHISLHMYFANRAKNTAEYLALNAKLDAYIGTIASTIEFVRADEAQPEAGDDFASTNGTSGIIRTRRTARSSPAPKGWPHAPRLLEDIYNFEDVLQVGCILNTFIRRSDVVKIACIAQLVNVIAPIMTEPRRRGVAADDLLSLLFRLVFGRGEALATRRQVARLRCARSPTTCPISTSAGVHDEEGGTLTFFAVNRHGSEAIDLEVSLQGFGAARIVDHQVMTSANLEAVNTLKNPTASDAEQGKEGRGQGRPPDGEAAALFLPDDAAEPGAAINHPTAR